jgi:MFS family permease
MRGLPERIGVLRRRDFRLLFGAQAVSGLGDRMVSLALAFAVLELGGSVSDVGLVLAARTFPLVAFLLVGGVVADRVSRRAVMVVSDLVRFASQGVLAALLIGGAAEVWAVALLSGLTGAATGFFSPASVGLLPAIVEPEELQQANGLRATALSGGEIAGPAIAGVLAATVGPGWPLGIDSATFLVSAVLLAAMRVPPRAERRMGTFLADLREGWTEFVSRTWVWTFVAGAAAGNLLWAAWSVLGPVVADRDLGGPAVWGSIIAALGTGALVGGLAAIAIRPRRPLVVSTVAFGLVMTPLALLAAGAPAWLVAVAALAGGVGMMLGNTVWEATLQRLIPAESLSRVSAYDWFGSLAFHPLGMAIWGPISVAIGIQASLWLASGLLLAIAVALLAVPDIQRVTLPSGRYT